MDLCIIEVGNLVIQFPIYLVVNMYNDLSGKPTKLLQIWLPFQAIVEIVS